MHSENDVASNGVLIHQEETAAKKDAGIESSSLTLNATSTPAITMPNKIVDGTTTTNPSTNGGHSPSLLPVSVQWLGQNPNLLGKFLEYYNVILSLTCKHMFESISNTLVTILSYMC